MTFCVTDLFPCYIFSFITCSLIATPPPERVPIKTHLSTYTKERVISAIKHELDRGGQVFYVLPRIKGNLFIDVSLYYVYTCLHVTL